MTQPVRRESPVPVRPLVGPNCPPRLAQLIRAGYLVMLDGRFSRAAGRNAYRQAAQNVHTAARLLAEQQVVDVRQVLPTESVLARRLQASQDRTVNYDERGRKFTNRFLVLELPGVVVVVSTGSASKVAPDSWEQVSIGRTAREVARTRPALYFFPEVSRKNRSDPYDDQPLIKELDRLARHLDGLVFIGHGDMSVRELTDEVKLTLFLQSFGAAQSAKISEQQMREGRRAPGVITMGDGRMEYRSSIPTPPGVGMAWLRDPERSGRGRHTAFLDCPPPPGAPQRGYRPHPREATYGLSEVFKPGTTIPVDQVSLVQWYLRHRNAPGWSRRGCAQYLADHGFSTEGKRRQAGRPDARWQGRLSRSQVSHICDSLDRFLDVYETGTWVVGADGDHPLVYHNVLPPGGWARPEDFTRIRRARATGREQFASVQRFPMAGVIVTHRGVRYVLEGFSDGETLYKLRRTSDAKGLRGCRGAQIPAPELSRSIVAALAAAGVGLPVWTPPEDTDQNDPELTALLAELEADHRAITAQLEHRYAELYPHGRRSDLEGDLFQRRQQEWNELNADATRLTAQIRGVQAELRARRRRRPSRHAIAVRMVLDAVASLRDVSDVRFHEDWKAALQDGQVWTESIRVGGLHKTRTHWRFTLVLEDEKGARVHAVPVHGAHERATRGRRRLTALLDGMRAGRPLPRTACGAHDRHLRGLRAVLGLRAGVAIPEAAIQTSRELRIAMAVRFPPGRPSAPDASGLPPAAGPPLTRRQLPAAARRLGEPLALVRRVAAIYAGEIPAQRRWRLKGDAAVAELFARAAAAGGQVHRSGLSAEGWSRLTHAASRGPHARVWHRVAEAWVLEPCPHCDGTARAPLVLREATEPICLNPRCRRDTSGVPWPDEPYDRWVMCPDVWQQHAPGHMPPARRD